jgi:sterol desaturase/sphingolipid hydroxylase (fatty acid hydroxylase superfamily)
MRRADLTDAAYQAALSDWERERPASPLPALFRHRVLDGFTRAPPWAPYVLAGPLLVLALYLGLHRGADVAEALVGFAFGALCWSLLEYLLHRFFFHAHVKGETARIAVFLAHGHHHASPMDRMRIVAPPMQMGSALLLLFGICDLAFDGALLWLAFAGSIAAYLAYEAIHYAIHHGREGLGLLRVVRRHHLAHHHIDARSRWGISTPLWDWIFGTRGQR